MNDKEQEAVGKLLDECEREFYSQIDENKFPVHLFRAINEVRVIRNQGEIYLSTGIRVIENERT